MLKKVLAFFTGISLLIPAFGTIHVVSASGGIEFKIEAPATARVGEAIDVTVKAVRKDGQIATDYRGSIVFSTKWIGDTVPMPGKWVPFTDEDNGEKKFSKWVIFKKAGKQELYVSDLSDDITGEVSIVVEEGSATITNSNEEITIITPSADAKIAGSVVTVSGKTRKNSKVSLSLNGSDAGVVVSDIDGLFTKDIQNINQENNILKASLLDGSNSVVATSSEVRFSKENSEGSVYGVMISPSTTVEPSADVTFNIETAKGLSEVTLVIDGATLTAKEISDGKYSVQTKAPQKTGNYPISVTTKTLTAQTSTQENITTLTVEEKEKEPILMPSFKNVKAETKENRVTFSFAVENPPADLATFKITYGSTGAVVTQPVNKILKNGIYTWYIDKLSPGDYTFKIFGQKADGGLIDGLVSESIMATIGITSCTVSNVGKISIKTDTSKSVLSWEAVENATAYNVYRIDSAGKYSLVQKVTNPNYTLYLSKWAITYENFAVKALCGDGTESKDYTEASRVQTGPGMIALVVIVSAIISALILRRRAS